MTGERYLKSLTMSPHVTISPNLESKIDLERPTIILDVEGDFESNYVVKMGQMCIHDVS